MRVSAPGCVFGTQVVERMRATNVLFIYGHCWLARHSGTGISLSCHGLSHAITRTYSPDRGIVRGSRVCHSSAVCTMVRCTSDSCTLCA